MPFGKKGRRMAERERARRNALGDIPAEGFKRLELFEPHGGLELFQL
jgi:hypothetical protein